jgi:hypothetical protein
VITASAELFADYLTTTASEQSLPPPKLFAKHSTTTASELYGMTHGFDISTAIKSFVDKILQINLPLIQVTDSKSLYDCLVRLRTIQEKRLMIDVMCL